MSPRVGQLYMKLDGKMLPSCLSNLYSTISCPPSVLNANLTIMERLLISFLGELKLNRWVGSLHLLPLDQTHNLLFKPYNSTDPTTGLGATLEIFHFTKAMQAILFSIPTVIAQGSINSQHNKKPRTFCKEQHHLASATIYLVPEYWLQFSRFLFLLGSAGSKLNFSLDV